MSILSDRIEEFIKEMMSEYEGMIELQRNELAEYFRCAPSQINYVLATRFSPEQGYMITSRRGGGGYIKVSRIMADENEYLMALISKLSGGEISQKEADQIIDGLMQLKIIQKSQEVVMKAAVADKAVKVPATIKNHLRANILKEMLLATLASDDGGK